MGTGMPGTAAAKEYETIGFIKYSHFTEFMADRELDGLCRQYKRHFEQN